MKKSLIALAVLAASGAAMAQSSVTAFGVVDTGVGRISNSGGNSVTGVTTGGNATSRLGFRGVEDLGGGLKAGFWLEGGIRSDVGDGNSGGASGTGFEFKRRATVSLLGNFGEVRLGRDFLASYTTLSSYDPFGDNGFGATFQYNKTGGFENRKANTVSYFLPENLGGFFGQVQFIAGENTNGTFGKGNGYSVALGYKNGPLSISGGASKLNDGHLVTNATGVGSSADSDTYNIGASYDLGVVKISGVWNQEKLKTPTEVKFSSYLVGLSAPLGGGVLKLSYQDLNNKTFGASQNDATKISLGYVYDLSKRTALYGTYARISNDGAATYSIGNGGLSAGNPGVGRNSTGYEFGIRHAF
jgi:predicted porin